MLFGPTEDEALVRGGNFLRLTSRRRRQPHPNQM
jgi:hypothetical protein